ncbi:flavin reductase family protein [Halobacillus salinus]|uniref:flavin reductase family protein n=1 Tax=Halobacillus salinus TaxID=192814 RepID=UPI0009A9108E|nr:flavin reductase family protein [Halobacillus salinus]
MERQDHIKMHSYPGMVAVVGVHTEDGVNFMAAGWHSYLSMEPAMYGVAVGRERYTYHQLKDTGRFTINFLPWEHADSIQFSGTTSGYTIDKGELMDWYSSDSTLPLLKGAYLAYECDLKQMVPTGDHEWVVGEIRACHYEENFFAQNGLPDFKKLNIPLYLGRSTYLKLDETTEKLAINEPKPDKKS